MSHIFMSFLFSLSFAVTPNSIYDIEVHDINGKAVPLAQYQGKVLLIVNTASKCGFTPQMKDLETIYKRYHDQGFEILAFPSNDFKQDPAENSEISSFAKKNYEVTFPFFEKGVVSGEHKQPLYLWLTSHKSGLIFKEVQWNFEKFLIGRDGQVIDRWNSPTKPTSDSITKAIEAALAEKNSNKTK